MVKHYFNLTNGIEFLLDGIKPDGFIRIQSTACEQKRWSFILQELDYSFLIDLAAGHTVIVYDCGARKKVPRAVYQGLEWVRYVLNRRWFGIIAKPKVRGNDCRHYFDECYRRIPDAVFKKIDYAKRFVNCTDIRLYAETKATTNDGNKAYYRNVLQATG